MADELVAELTLRLRNEMLGEIQAIRDEFSGLKDSLTGFEVPIEISPISADMQKSLLQAEADATGLGAILDADTQKMQAMLIEMSGVQEDFLKAPAMEIFAPSEIETNLKQAQADTKALVQSIVGIEPASAAAANSILAIGTAIDSDTAKMQALLADVSQAQEDMAKLPAAGGGSAGGGGAGGSGGAAGGGGNGQNAKKSKKHDDGGDDFFAFGKGLFGKIMEGVMVVGAALNAADSWSSFDTLARQITVTEGLTPAQSDVEVPHLKRFADHLGTRWANDSKDILEAYEFLVTDSLSKKAVEAMMPGLAEASTAYNVPVTEIDQSAFTLYKNLGIPADQMGNALAILHHAAMMGHFTMADFSSNLPELGGQMGLLGMHGMTADIVGASALETIRKNTGTGGEAATELNELMMYLHSPMALRMFDRTTRMNDLLGASGRELLDKYHVKPLDLPEYLNAEESKGVDPINAMADYFSELTSKISSPTDKAFVIGAFLHNQTAQNAMLALVQYHQDFSEYQQKLSNVSDATLARDWYTATAGRSADTAERDEQARQVWRGIGSAADWLGEGTTKLMEFGYTGGYGPDDTWTGRAPGTAGNSFWRTMAGWDGLPWTDKDTAQVQPNTAPLQISPQIPITVNVHVDKNQNVAVTGGITGGVTTTPGTNVRVNQGNVLGGIH